MLEDDHVSPRPRNRIAVAATLVAIVIVVGGAGLFWYVNQPVPEEVSLEKAVEDIANTQPPSTDTTDVPAGLDGVWTVDTSIGEFSFGEATSSFLGFRINEELVSVGATTAVGRTPVVAGSLTLSGTSITETVIEGDLSQIVTNASRRNRAVWGALDTNSFPIATFTLSSPIDIGAAPVEGDEILVSAVGDLEIKGVTHRIEIPLEAQLVVVVGATDITFADWGVEMPTSSGVVSVEDHGILELQLFFRRG
jgi:polyisoprenoid-binding protein YceI